jgi:hypothetical protein
MNMTDAKPYRIEGRTLYVSPARFDAMRLENQHRHARTEFDQAMAYLRAAGLPEAEADNVIRSRQFGDPGLSVVVDRGLEG